MDCVALILLAAKSAVDTQIPAPDTGRLEVAANIGAVLI
jgi:hypothetical protein